MSTTPRAPRDGTAAGTAGAVQVARVGATAGGHTLLHDVSFTVPTGAVSALVGPNGAGKSTLLRALSGAGPRAGGSVHLGSQDLFALSRRERARRVALVEQEVRSEFALTVRQAVALGRTPHQSRWSLTAADDDTVVEDALVRAGAAELAGRELGTLSGGEQQRVQLARALAQQPELLLLDEPTNHLDVRAQLRTLGLLRELAADGVTVLAALHDLNLAASYCDHVVVLADGRVRASGPVAPTLTPALIAETYGVQADVLTHPRTGRPLIAFSPR
ncbi:ATP-binding cassette domain-containing protein [Nocardioides sp. zg-536]|uniref:ATP-binding cassette domain-containing protein n=1 Tax=Nocardioides faecalis TaxID=2803858 RepID=A0A938Y7U8_9ACTN|nr:ATP-binding cassette domain-containing protein [Nocardioides faecalis]MBM9459096.1 ATP-binding cassette domain-containing protein [Nocardioides faecalis]QVI57355.1 ATP-binding cassette domain-containing protein [Nocardioides faecalis]